ncbi:MAG: hypothetical protein D6730_20075 [Bacteroidetes bacterium]|nr:MAG: hypothetical protein D6730_20075 [Bacteroidota bacterium]
MKKLSTDWFMEGLLDYEYKKYVLLAYLQHVSQEFAQERLYPSFSDLIFHYKNLAAFKENKQKLYERFPKSLSEEEFKQLRLVMKPEIEEDVQLKEIESIVEYAIPAIREHLKEGKGIYEYIDEQLSIEPIGILPLYKQEGYILLRINQHKEVKAFEYRIVFFENTEANYHGISMNYLQSFRLSLANTYEAIKRELTQLNAQLPNPATYLLYTVKAFPEEASLLPVAKRKMLAYLK